MVRAGRVALLAACAVLVGAVEARAQLSLKPFGGAGTFHLGATTGGDVSGGSFTLGGSVSVVEPQGWGAELDFGFANGDDNGAIDRANLQTYMLNLIGIWPTGKLRPFFIAGAGGLRVHGCAAGCPQEIAWSDWGLSFGAGAFYRLNPALGLRGDVRYFRAVQDHPDPSRPDGFDFWRISIGVSTFWNIVP